MGLSGRVVVLLEELKREDKSFDVYKLNCGKPVKSVTDMDLVMTFR